MVKKPSEIHGYGIFSNRAIAKGEKYYDIPLDTVSDSPKKRWARIGDKYFCDTKVLNWINHSCRPNSAIDVNIFTLFSLRDIKPGDEITCDYNQTELDGLLIKCNCGSNRCRGFFAREE